MLPTRFAGTFSFSGLGGISHILQSDEDNKGNIVGKSDYGAGLGMVAMNHMMAFSSNSFLKFTLSASGNGSHYDYRESDSGNEMQLSENGSWEKSSLRTALMYSTKLNPQHRVVTGIKFTRHFYNLYEHYFDEDLNRWVYAINMKCNGDIWQSYISWKFRLNDRLTFINGLHGIYFTINGEYNLEPRLGLEWQIDQKQTVHAGFGMHSKMESVIAYYTILNDEYGGSYSPNKKLGLSKARHYVLGYGYRFTKNLNSKIELYYQDLYNIPVEDNDSSYFSMINSDEGYINKALINDGTGYNYGIEFTLERFLSGNFYFLFTASVYDSKYRAKDGILRNTKYNGNFCLNFLTGKEFNLGRGENKKVLGLNTKFFYNGGRRYIPVDFEASKQEEKTVYKYSGAWDNRLDDIFQMNLSVTYRINRPKTAHEFILDISNVTCANGKTWEYYNKYTGEIDYDRQLFMIPNIMYRVHF